MFSTFHFVAFEVKLLTTLEKVRTQVGQNTKFLQLLLEKVEATDESSALEPLPVEVHFPIANREELDKLEDQLDNADVLNRVVCTCHIFFPNINNSSIKILIFLMSINDSLNINMTCFDSCLKVII